MSNLKNDIQKYLRGELSAAEMHALERRALNDPFLAEALDGINALPEINFREDLTKIHEAIKDRTTQKRGGGFLWSWPLRIAAGLLLLVVSSYIVILLTGNSLNNDERLALNKEVEKDMPAESPVATDSITSNGSAGDLPVPDPTIQIDDTRKRDEPSTQLPKPVQLEPSVIEIRVTEAEVPVAEATESDAQTGEEIREITIEKNEVKEQKTDSDKKATDAASGYVDIAKAEKTKIKKTQDVARIATAPASVEEVAKQSQEQPPFIKVISGRVVDAEDGTPIPGVDISLKGTTKGTVTDMQGNYEITIPTENSSLVFSFVGLQPQEVIVNDKENKIDVSLLPDLSQLSEVVVIGYSSEATAAEKENSWEPAIPEGGRKEYKKYLEKNMTYPEQAIENKVEGKVTAQFTIEPNGQLSDFRVVKSLGYGCDEEVIRLIKQGPAWTPTKRNAEPVRGKVKVRMRFTLPETNNK